MDRSLLSSSICYTGDLYSCEWVLNQGTLHERTLKNVDALSINMGAPSIRLWVEGPGPEILEDSLIPAVGILFEW